MTQEDRITIAELKKQVNKLEKEGTGWLLLGTAVSVMTVNPLGFASGCLGKLHANSKIKELKDKIVDLEAKG